MAANWSELAHDLLVEIAGRFTKFEDFVAFGMVCRPWKLAAVKKNFRFNSTITRVPLLMLAPTKGGSLYRGFFDLSTGKTLQVWLPKATGKRCYSSKGWLMTVGRDMSANLLHPFAGVEIKLPHLKTFSNWRSQRLIMVYAHFIDKFVLSSDPLTTSDYIVMVIYGSPRKLGYYKAGDKTWTILNTCNRVCFLDVIYYRDCFYAINCGGYLLVFDCKNMNKPSQVIRMPDDLTDEIIEELYVVESDGKLFAVFRDGVYWTDYLTGGTYNFQVFEIDFTANTYSLVKNLGNRAFFLGRNSSVSYEASADSNIKPNCIYFTDDYWESYFNTRKGGGKDMGIFNVEDETFEPHFKGTSYNRINPPMWVEF